MKKIITTACAVAFAVIAQATTYNWQITTYATVTGSEDPIGIDSLVYFFDGANGSYTAAQMVELLSTDKDWSSKVTAASNIGTATSLAANDNEISAAGTIDTVSGASGAYSKGVVDAFMVMFDSDSIADAKKFYVMDWSNHDVTDAEANSSVLFTTAEMIAVGDPSGWTALKSGSSVPEPTSGLMLLLGVAGLALRRKRA